jgi:UDP-GlcNAc:undecaprenyl-phosphate/decaprenyl-phosphate GlcNAc-1-phosphate transferase
MSFLTLNVTFIAAVVALLVSPLFFWITRRFDLVDMPGSQPHKIHRSPTPIAGGLVVLCTVVVVGLIFSRLDDLETRFFWLPALVIFVFGLWDDLKRISPYWKLAGQIFAAVLLILSGVQVLLFSQNWLNIAVTILWIVGITNAFNFVDSMDGLVVGVGGVAAGFFMLVTMDAGQEALAVFSAILLGTCIGTFYFNAQPARYFMGDSGSQFLGFMLGALGIAYNPVGFEPTASWYVPILLMGVPIFDTVLVVYSRARRGRPVYRGAQDHTYHRLVRLGMSPNRAVLTMHVTALLLGNIAFVALGLQPIWANMVFFTVLMLGVGCVLFLDNPRRHA